MTALDVVVEHNISIHASRGGSDPLALFTGTGAGDFNPRFPRGKRQPKP